MLAFEYLKVTNFKCYVKNDDFLGEILTLGAYSSQITGARSSKFFTELALIFLNTPKLK